MRNKKWRAAKILADRRRVIQVGFGLGLYVVVAMLGVSLWWVLVLGAITGVVFGKVFCRWMCPIGFVMELLTSMGGKDGKFQQMYQYHKLGCPIAWVSGALNKFSFFKVKLEKSSCARCGVCDSVCYLSSLEPARYSLFKIGKERPGEAFACSKCLACVSACPSGSLSYKIGLPIGQKDNGEE